MGKWVVSPFTIKCEGQLTSPQQIGVPPQFLCHKDTFQCLSFTRHVPFFQLSIRRLPKLSTKKNYFSFMSSHQVHQPVEHMPPELKQLPNPPQTSDCYSLRPLHLFVYVYTLIHIFIYITRGIGF